MLCSTIILIQEEFASQGPLAVFDALGDPIGACRRCRSGTGGQEGGNVSPHVKILD